MQAAVAASIKDGKAHRYKEFTHPSLYDEPPKPPRELTSAEVLERFNIMTTALAAQHKVGNMPQPPAFTDEGADI